MRKLRIALLLFFAVTAAVFAAYTVQDRRTSDYEAPVIHADSDSLQVSVSATEENLLAGMTAEDNLDGNVTDTLVIASKSKFIAKGTRRVDYAAFDNNKNVGTYSREVTYTDYVSPHFRLTEPLRFYDGGRDRDFLKPLRAEDCLDGDITRQIKVNFGDSTAISDSIREQEVSFQVSNSAGDTAVLDLTARIEDRASYYQPAPALREYVVYVRQGEAFAPSVYLSGIWTGGEAKRFDETEFTPENVIITENTLNIRKPGAYQVTFQLVQNEDISLGSATMYVIVEE